MNPGRSLPSDAAKELAAVLAEKTPAKMLVAAKSLAKRLGEGATAVAVYDAVCATIVESGARARAPAGDAYAAARTLERRLKTRTSLDLAVERARVLAPEGALWVKEITLVATDIDAGRARLTTWDEARGRIFARE